MRREYRLFIASPGDVPHEREAIGKVVGEINLTHGEPLKYRLTLVRWETDVAPGAGRPQEVINRQIGSYDIFVGIMWHRFGTPTGLAGSGTEEEFRGAYRAWAKNHKLILMFYFCQKPFMPRSVEEMDQMRQVLLFRKELEGKALIWDYDGPEVFADVIRKHLCLRLNNLVMTKRARGAKPNPGSIRLLRKNWDRMGSGLQRALSIAYNENRRAGDGGIKTRDLFAALVRTKPRDLIPIIAEIPKNALPGPIKGPMAENPYILTERPWLSPCVESSLDRLSRNLPEGRKMMAADVFADIAKNGHGESVRLLRQHHIDAAKIDRILKLKNIDVIGD